MAKVTKRDNFAAVREVLEGLGNTELVDFVDAQVALLDKRKGAERGLTKTQVENEALKAVIVEVLADAGEGVTATDVATAVDITVQRAAQLLKQLVAAEAVTRTEAKGKVKALFAVNAAE